MSSDICYCGFWGFVARQYGKREITILPFDIELLKFYTRCIFTRSTSLHRVRKADLKAVFDFTYKQLILSSLLIISKMGFGEKNVLFEYTKSDI
ncbi:hypothetical protein RclHR1_00110009 [Rhizophagus clarus]|uniref:Uncharacterized protein n=1 Tax=Rhizophagus clarus TaxID=94130 RepID=A0A2Z6QVX2_9GLOM|nr:hypothetical protein RclHR1_00110009 [Rhizophagus clarus]GES98017.1 hypothetical protein RCL_e11289_RclHR1_00110009 [Rhizophagus clarus]